MASFPEINRLLATLVSNLQTLDAEVNEEEDEDSSSSSSLGVSISKLNRSLNLSSEDSRVGVLEAALSLMCFKSPEVFDSSVEYLVKTIVCVLDSSITCKEFRFGNEELLQIGSLISSRICLELIELSDELIRKLGKKNGSLASLLLHAVVRMAASTPCYQYLSPFGPVFYAKSIEGKSVSVSKLLHHLPRELPLERHERPLRLLLWYLDPLSLKNDVSKIFQDALQRPFLCLNKELHERVDWCNVVTCLVISPTMFIETRALLHKWFLLTGLASILEFLVNLVSVIMDINSRPTWWGIPVKLASNLPFSNVYFPCKHQFLRILSGPLSCEGFVLLAHAVSKTVSHDPKQFDVSFKPAAINIQAIDHKSEWALAINFPNWFYFACATLFSQASSQENCHLKYTLQAPKDGQEHGVESVSTAAARYTAWILNPISKSTQDFLVNYLIEVSEAWALQKYGSAPHAKEATTSNRRKAKKLFLGDTEEYCFSKEYDSTMVELWLREFQNNCILHANNLVANGLATCGANDLLGLSVQKSLLIRRVPLGILIGAPGHVTADSCSLLLHYAATRKILHSRKAKSFESKYKRNFDGEEDLDESSKQDALAGACLVFSLTDTVESMSTSLFESEQSALEFIYQVKLKASKYLIMCINRLILLHAYEDGVLLLTDLRSRLIHWRYQGREVLQINQDLEDVTASLNRKLSSL